MTTRAAIAFLGLLWLAAPTGAENAASGSFDSKSWNVPVEDAYAFRGAASLGGGSAIFVAISNFEFGEELFDRYLDRRYMISRFFADDETKVVYLEFGEDGAYRGYSYFFEGGDGCGFCGGGDAKSTVRVAAGRIAGKVAKKDDDRSFDVTFDVPIASDDYGAKQGASGGEPGKAYLAYHAAAAAGDAKRLRELVSAAQLARWKKAEADGESAGYLRYLTDDRFATATVREGFVRSDRAVLRVRGESPSIGRMHGEAHLVREEGRWLVEDETLQVGSGD